MNVPFFVATLLVVVLAALGWPGARLVSRTSAWSVAAAPAAAGLVASFAVMAALVTQTSMLAWIVVAAVGGWVALVVRRGRGPHWSAPAGDDPGITVLVIALLVALLPVVLVDLPPVESDARFIWWFHAAWFRGGGSVARDGMANPAFGPTHSGYPPLLPAVVSSVWHLGGAYDREVALRVGQLVTAAFMASAGFFVAFVLRLPRRPAMAAAALVVGVCWGANASVGLSGFADLTWAAVLLTAAVLLLAGPTDRRTLLVGALFAAAASMIKFEAGAAALLLVTLTVFRAGRQWRRAAPPVIGVVTALAGWVAVTTIADVPVEDRGQWSSLVDVFDRGSVVHQRVFDTLGNLVAELGPLIGLAVLAVAALVVVGRLAGLPLRQPGLVALLALSAGYLLVDAAAVGVASLPLSEYTDSGNYRTVLVVRVVVLVDVLLAAVAALRAVGSHSPADGTAGVAAADDSAAGRSPAAVK